MNAAPDVDLWALDEVHFQHGPDLNPIERVWKLTRRLCLHDQYFPTLDRVILGVEKEFRRWTHGSVTLRRLCALS